MTTTNKDLAAQAQAIAKGSDGLRRRAALCVAVACGTSTTLDAARRHLDEIGLADVRRAAHALMDEITAQAGVRSS